MSTLLQHLNNESILLMYLAGELPAEDRAKVEAMLAGDGRLREELEQLRAAYEGVDAALAEADAAERLALSPATAARRVGEAARAWHARRLAEPAAREARRFPRLPRWAYGAAVAALVAIGYTAWWGLQPDAPIVRREVPPGPQNQPGTPQYAVDPWTGVTPEEWIAFMGPWGESPLLHDAADAELEAAEADLYALLESTSDTGFVDDGASLLLMDDTDER